MVKKNTRAHKIAYLDCLAVEAHYGYMRAGYANTKKAFLNIKQNQRDPQKTKTEPRLSEKNGKKEMGSILR